MEAVIEQQRSRTTASDSAVTSPERSQQNSRLLVIDGHSMAFRAFYALPAENFATTTGQHTNAVYGFLTMLLSMIREQQPTHVAVAFDVSTPTFRSEEYGEYKAGRQETPEEFSGQIDLIGEVLEALNIPAITVDGYEADDIVATFSAQAEQAGWTTVVVSGDRDAFQLISETTAVLYPTKGVSEIPPMTTQTVLDKYGVRPAQYPELAALVGEKADNLPGVPGVGAGFASKWLKQYGDLQGVIDNADQIKGKKGQALREHLDDVIRNRKLNALVRDLDLPIQLEATALSAPDHDHINDLFDSLEFNRVRERVFDVFHERLGLEGSSAQASVEVTIELITQAAQLRDFLSTHGGTALGVFAQITAPEVITRRKIPAPGDYGTVAAVSIATEDQAGVIELSGSTDTELIAEVNDFLLSGSYQKVVYDLKTLIKAGGATEVLTQSLNEDQDLHHIAEVVDDILLCGYVLQPDRRGFDLPALAQTYLNTTLEVPKTAPVNKQGELDLGETHEPALSQEMQTYLGQAGSMLIRLHEVMYPELIARDAHQLVTEVEIPLSRVLAVMEETGVAVNTNKLHELLEVFSDQAQAAEDRARESIDGDPVNLGSPKQLQTVLFDRLNLPKTRKTKTGHSTDAESLNDLLDKTDHPFLHNLMAYRDATKLKQTVQGLLDSVATDQRIHTTYSQTAAATGRLSSLNPNLQNIPVRTETGRRIRDIFQAGTIPGCDEPTTLLTADYSQIEMRIMAHLSEDAGLIQAYQEGEDLHRFVGSQVFDVRPAEVTTAMRDKVKAMSYGLAYGLSSFGLSKQLRIPVDEARELMSSYFQRFGSVQKYLRGVVRQARNDGYTSTMMGRRRYLPDLQSDNRQLRDMAERAALNAPIQGSAADLIKVAMLGVARRLREESMNTRMLLQVHDELILEVPESERERAETILVEEMSQAAELSVPLDVQVGRGRTWQQAAH
ncbi:DNA polymerase I [Auritidibacter sp. NML120779]|nr:DNA polymerase I [Auritidibacter sp. NML120779]